MKEDPNVIAFWKIEALGVLKEGTFLAIVNEKPVAVGGSREEVANQLTEETGFDALIHAIGAPIRVIERWKISRRARF